MPVKIFYGNEKSQAKRLKELAARANTKLPNVMAPLLDKKVDFIQKIINTRNYYIHFADDENKRLTEMSIPFAVMILECLTFTTLMLELGISPALVEERIRQFRKWQIGLSALRNWETWFIRQSDFLNRNNEHLSERAYFHWKARNEAHGNDLDDWLNAEVELLGN